MPHPFVTKLAKHDALRSLGVPAYQLWASVHVARQGERILVNSVPKSGTHLLSRLFEELPGIRFSGRHCFLDDFSADRNEHGMAAPTPAEMEAVVRYLTGVRRRQFATAHLPHTPELAVPFLASSLRIVHVVRDPRDVVVSWAHYIAGSTRHPLHQRLLLLPTLAERIHALIVGAEPVGRHPAIPPIDVILGYHLGWMGEPSVEVSRFEDLIGERGGGDRDRQLDEITRIASHVGVHLDVRDAHTVADRMWGGERSATFRTGQIGGWGEVLTDDHLLAMDERAGTIIEAMGYRTDAESGNRRFRPPAP